MSALAAHFLVGPTASGKSAVAQYLALQARPPRPILSADSMTIYRGMDVGTAKPEAADRAAVPSFGFDLVDPDRPFSVGDWLAAVRAAAPAIAACGAPPIVVGGTGLYVKCLTEGLDSAPTDPVHRAAAEALLNAEGLAALQAAARALNPAEFAKLRDPENPRRVVRAYELLASGQPLPAGEERPRPKLAGLALAPDDLRARIARRARQMFAYGLVEEVRALRAKYPALSDTARHAIGYEEAARVLDGKISEEEAIRLVAVRTGQYAKRQMTWFRHQADVVWIEVGPRDGIERLAGKVQAVWRTHGPAALRI
ncbi:MAG TPA: tRNA (adenosine(37)-N6)-dimethylallyltransferase MiaA [Kiritimatiellia bacterium]|nr:tRNA (adenosine(37)-N6)-dimethylallyltransferase MiaA [Kiritimatiellia bacterium]